MAKNNTALNSIIADICKKYGNAAIVRAGSAGFINVKYLPSGVPALDFALGGGYPRGRIIHLFGPERAGKTRLAMGAAAQAQAMFPKKPVLWLDFEETFDAKRARQVGLDLDRLFVSQPASAEEGCDCAVKMCDQVSCVVIDSVAAFSSKIETEAEMTDNQMGMTPRIVNKFLRKWKSVTAPKSLNYEAPTLFLINQLREKMVKFGNPETTPGGRGLRHFVSAAVDIRRGDFITLKEEDDSSEPIIIGHDVKFHVVKNNTFVSDKKGKFILCTRKYNPGGYAIVANGVDFPVDLVKYGVYYGVLEKRGAWYFYAGEKLGQGRLPTQATIFNDMGLQTCLYNDIMEAVRVKHGVEGHEEVSKAGKTSSGLKRRKGKAGIR